MSKCTKKNCPMVGVLADCDLKDCSYRTEADQSKDTIYREDAIEAVINKPAWHGSDGSYYHGADIRDALKSLPSADRPQGEWICKGDWAECSLCGADSGTIMDGLERVPRYTRFCPECGARMKGVDDD